MKKFCIIRNEEKDPNSEIALQILDQLKALDATATICVEGETIDDTAECLLVLGGDGTLLRSAKKALSRQIPLLGINLGTLGYLAEVNRDCIPDAIEKVVNDDFTIEKRMMLEGSIYHNGRKVYQDIALNDIVLSREGTPRVIRFKNYVNGEFLNEYRADGIIISTPTGSTGYSLSAGGPIISPTAYLIMMTALAPHTLNTRSIVFSKRDRICVELGEGRMIQPERARVDFDGAIGYPIETGDTVVIKKARQATNIIKIRQVSFLETLRNKLSNN